MYEILPHPDRAMCLNDSDACVKIAYNLMKKSLDTLSDVLEGVPTVGRALSKITEEISDAI